MSTFGHVVATVHRRRSPAALVVGVSLFAALLGAVLAMAVGEDPGAAPGRATTPRAGRTVSAGDLRLTLANGWTPTRTGPVVPGFEGARTVFARGWNGDVAIALLPAARPSLLPGRLDAAKRRTSSRPRVTRVGTVHGYLYVWAPKGGRVLGVVAVPTTQGIATIACSSTIVAPQECATALSGVRLARGSFLPLSADAAFRARLPAAVAMLDAQRVRLRTRLARASTAEQAAGTAAGLAGAYAAAARALRPLAAPRSRALGTVRLLDSLRAGYGRLASAVRAADRVAFAATARAIGEEESSLAARLTDWQRVLARSG
jgi:hypothetical protein